MPQPTAEQTPSQRQIARALHLEKVRYDAQLAIGKNRDYLRLMAANDELTAPEKKWLATFYPEKENGEHRSEEDRKATVKAKEAARKPPAPKPAPVPTAA